MAVLRNGSKCSHTACMLRFFTVSRLAMNTNLIFEIGSKESWPKGLCFLCLNRSDVERLTFFKNGIIFHNLFNIIFRFFERGNSLIAFNNFGACVIGRKRQRQFSIKAIYELF